MCKVASASQQEAVLGFFVSFMIFYRTVARRLWVVVSLGFLDERLLRRKGWSSFSEAVFLLLAKFLWKWPEKGGQGMNFSNTAMRTKGSDTAI